MEHREKKDYDNKEEFLSGFKKSDKLTPVITLTVYWGQTSGMHQEVFMKCLMPDMR